MNAKALRELIQRLCEENGHTIVLDGVRAALESHLQDLENDLQASKSTGE